jgi:capsular exopolysaccharide synthesis family protein
VSRFFNETRKVRPSTGAASDSSLADLDEVMAVVKEKVGSEVALSGVAAEQQMRSLVEQVEDVRAIASAAVPAEVNHTRKLWLPSEDTLFASGLSAENPEAVEAFERLRNRLVRRQNEHPNLRTLAVSSAEAGEGKTLVTANLAIAAARLQKSRILLVDADLRSRGLTELFQSPSGPGLTDLLAGRVSFDVALMSTELSHLYFMSAGSAISPGTQMFANGAWKEMLETAMLSFDVVLVDSPPLLQVADFELIAAPCGGILLVVRAHRTTAKLLQQVLTQLDASRIVGVVFNAAESTGKQYYYSVRYNKYAGR